MIINKEPYEISVWEDISTYVIEKDGVIKTVEHLPSEDEGTIINHTFREQMIAPISAATSDTSPIRAFNPKLKCELNGSHTLTFDLLYQYYDEEVQCFKINPFIALLVNERKIKLKYEDKWYHFIIKNVVEDNDKHVFSYSCNDQYITELGKTGFEIEMDTELENNMGTAVELGECVLKGTDWRIDTDNCDTIKQRNTEALCPYVLPSAINALVMDDYWEPDQDRAIDAPTYVKDSYISIAAGQTIWVFYSSLTDGANVLQFLYHVRTSPDDDYRVDGDGVIINSPNLSIERSVLSDCTVENVRIDNQYLGSKLVDKQQIKYIQKIDEYCAVWDEGNTTYYSYTENEYASPAEIQNLITNAANFTTSNGWIGVDDATAIFSTWHDPEQGELQVIPVLRLNFGESHEIKNTGFFDHRELTDGFQKGEQYMLIVKTSTPGVINGAVIRGVPEDSAINTPESALTTCVSTSDGVPANYEGFILTVNTSISYEEMLKYVLNFYILGSGVTDLIDAKLFKYVKIDGHVFIPDMETAMNAVIRTKYNMFNDSNLATAHSKESLAVTEIFYDEPEEHGYTPHIRANFEKVRSIDGSKSNRFNLLQEICETFECWALFNIETFDNGEPYFIYEETTDTELSPNKTYYTKIGNSAVLYDEYNNDENFEEYNNLSGAATTTYYERKYNKTVAFKEYIGKNNYAGFRYGINLKSIQRKIDSMQIVSKMIVQPNVNEHAKNGSCTIQRATMNPTRETAMFNFNYFIQNGLLNREDLNRDLYGDGLGYFSKLYNLNIAAQPLIDELGFMGKTLTQLSSKQQVYAALINQANEEYGRALEDISKALGSSVVAATVTYNPELHNDAIQKYIITRDCMSTAKTKHEEVLNNINSLVVEAKARYQNLLDRLHEIQIKKEALNQTFYSKYSRFIQEGSWISEDYVDDDMYYMDAVAVGRTSAFPKLTYTIQVIELSQLDDYKSYAFEIGDKTYIEDTEFFGYQNNGKPYQEEIVISEVTKHLDDPSQNVITVQNYKTQFEDLFQRIAAATTSLQYSEGIYKRAGSAFNEDGTINSEYFRNSLKQNVGLIMGAPNGDVVIDQDKGTITITSGTGELLINNRGVIIGTGGNYQTAISSEGINADVITTGRLNTGSVYVYADEQPTFRWDAYGLNAYAFNVDNDMTISDVNYNKYVRFDRFGLYGYVGATNFQPVSINEVIDSSAFSLTWEGLHINLPHGQGDKTDEVINVNNHFIVYGDGSIKAANGEFTGTVHATDIQLNDGNGYRSILEANQIKGDWINARNITVKNDSDVTTFNVDSNGNVSINGNITMGAGSTISWNTAVGNTTMGELKDNLESSINEVANNALIPEDVREMLREDYGISDGPSTTLGQSWIYSPNIIANRFVVSVPVSIPFYPTTLPDDSGFFIVGIDKNTGQEIFDFLKVSLTHDAFGSYATVISPGSYDTLFFQQNVAFTVSKFTIQGYTDSDGQYYKSQVTNIGDFKFETDELVNGSRYSYGIEFDNDLNIYINAQPDGEHESGYMTLRDYVSEFGNGGGSSTAVFG